MEAQQNNQVPAPRIPLSVDVEFKRSYARQASHATLRNISLSGAFLEHTAESVQMGDKIQVTLNVSGRVRKLHAEVIWTNTAGAGVRFHHSNNRDLQIVDDLMYFAQSKRSSSRLFLDEVLKKVS